MSGADRPVVIVDPVPFKVDAAALKKALGVGGDSPFNEEIDALAREADAAARPRGAFHLAPVEPVDDETVRIDGVRFTSRVLRVNLDGLGRVFPYLATCGPELDAWAKQVGDPMAAFWTDAIREQALRAAVKAVGNELSKRYNPGRRASMNPGSLPNWPISEQEPLFDLFGDTARTVGVELTPSFLMNPVKSVSGLWFETETSFQNCQLCPRENCTGRRAPYDPDLFGREYDA